MRTLSMAGGAVAADWPARIARVCQDPSSVDVALQPIVDLSRGTVAGYEALARLPGPGGPEPWFAAAAQHGLADLFEAVVLSRTLASREGLPPNAFVSVNVTPAALLTEAVQATLAAAGPLGGVVIEITEQAAVADYGLLLAAVAALRARGALIAVDDMGAGHASLSHVLELRPDFVKLDRGLVTDCDRDMARLAVLEMLGNFVGRIDAWVVAEGIERQEELDAVARIGMPLAQGYHLARPAPEAVALRPELAASIAHAAARRAEGEGLNALLEAIVVLDGADEAGIHATFARDRPPLYAIVGDDRGRPVGLLLGPQEPFVTAMTTGAADAPADVARRAMARPRERRFDPLVVCDELGRVTGIVTIERLVSHLAGL